jgi:hypothetical protein
MIEHINKGITYVMVLAFRHLLLMGVAMFLGKKEKKRLSFSALLVSRNALLLIEAM